jgi:hypothetical protein
MTTYPRLAPRSKSALLPLGLDCLLQGNLYLYLTVLYAPNEGEVLLQEVSYTAVEFIRPLALY